MSNRLKASRSKGDLSPIGDSDDKDFDNAPNGLSDECMTKIDEGIKWVVDFCDKTMAESQDQKPSEEDLKEDDSESDIHPVFRRRNPISGGAPLRFSSRPGSTIMGPRPMPTEQRIRHDRHRNVESDSGNPSSFKYSMSLEDARSIHEEGKAEFKNARSRSTGHRRRCGTRDVIRRFDSVQRNLSPPPSRPLPPNLPLSSSACIGRTTHTLPPLRPVSPLTFVNYDDDASACPSPLRWRKQGQEALNSRTNENAIRGISYNETANTTTISSPHQYDEISNTLPIPPPHRYDKTANTPPIPLAHRFNVGNRVGIPRLSEDALRGLSHRETLATLRHPNHAQQEPHVSYASEDTTRRRRQQIRLVTEED